MKAKLSIISALVLGGLVACTSIAGAADANGKQKGDRGDRKAGMERQIEMLSTNLNLTAAQKTKVTALMEEQGKQMRAMRDELQNLSQEERREKMKANREAMDKKMEKILTPEQYQKWLKTREQRMGREGQKKGQGKGERKKKNQ